MNVEIPTFGDFIQGILIVLGVVILVGGVIWMSAMLGLKKHKNKKRAITHG